MLVELPYRDFEKVRPIFKPLNHHLAVESVLAGSTPGLIFVDEVADPALALIWWGSRVFLAGQVQDEPVLARLRAFFLDTFYPQAQARGLWGYILFFERAWEPYVGKILEGKNLIAGERYYYLLEAADFTGEVRLEEGYRLFKIDQTFLADPAWQNIEFVTEEMVSERPSVEDFLARSTGYCITQGTNIVAWCMSEYNCGSRCEIGIMTAEGHRRRGLAKNAAVALITDVRAQGITDIGWHCWADNKPSVATALALGFSLREVFPVVNAYFDGQTHLIVHGIVSFNRGEVDEAQAYFERAERLGPLPAWAGEHAARARGRAG